MTDIPEYVRGPPMLTEERRLNCGGAADYVRGSRRCRQIHAARARRRTSSPDGTRRRGNPGTRRHGDRAENPSHPPRRRARPPRSGRGMVAVRGRSPPARPGVPEEGGRPESIRALRPLLGHDGGLPTGRTGSRRRARRKDRCARAGRTRARSHTRLRRRFRAGPGARSIAPRIVGPLRGGRPRVSSKGARRLPGDRAARARSRSSDFLRRRSRSGLRRDLATPLGSVRPVKASLLERLGREAGGFPAALLLRGVSPGPLEEEARRLAARLLCPDPSDSQQACASCRRVFAGIHPDLFAIEPEGVAIRVDRIREALAFGAGRPYEARHRVAVVSRAELMGPEAANALLKALEEPGQYLRWILTTTRPEALPPTILSRCASVGIRPTSLAQKRARW